MAPRNEFDIPVSLSGKMASSFFDYERFTVPRSVRRDWQNMETCALYDFQVSEAVKAQYRGTRLEQILNAMDHPGICPKLKIDMNLGDSQLSYHLNEEGGIDVTSKNYICLISHLLFQQFQLLFFASQVFYRMGRPLPEPPERFSIHFSLEKKTAVLTEAEPYQPSDPFLAYARDIAGNLSSMAVLRPEEAASGGRVQDFYQEGSHHGWMEASALDGILQDVPKVVYMLYDANANTFYVGKADYLVKRLRQHQKNLDGRDPIPHFTHFRYSCVSPEHWKEIYLIENAAIHDCAWLLEMPLARNYRPSLQDCVRRGLFPGDLSRLKLVNRVEHQTREGE